MTKQCIITRLTKERRGYLIEKTNFFIEREIATARPDNGRAGKGTILLVKKRNLKLILLTQILTLA